MKKRSITPWAVVSGVAATGLLLAGCATVTDLGEREGRFVSYAAAGTGIGVGAELPLDAEAPGSPRSPGAADVPATEADEPTAAEDAASEDPTTGDEKPDAPAAGQGDGESVDESGAPADPDAADTPKEGNADDTAGSTPAGGEAERSDTSDTSATNVEQAADEAVDGETEGSNLDGSQPAPEDQRSAAPAAEAADPIITVSPAQVTQADLADRNKGVKVTVTGLAPGTEIYDQLSNVSYTADDNGDVTFGVFYDGDTSTITGPIYGTVTWGDSNVGGDLDYEFKVVVTPTPEPTTDAPTEEPTTDAPTEEPTTGTPTEEPTTGPPTSDPTTTAAPTTDAPTDTVSPSATATDDAPSPSPTGWTGAPADPTTTGAGSTGSPSTTTRSADSSPAGASVHTGGESASPAPIVVGGGLIALGLAALVVLYIRRRRL